MARFFPTRSLLGQPVLLDEVLVGQRDFHGVEVFALDVLDEGHFHHVLVVGGADVGGYGLEPGQLGGSEAALAGYDLVLVGAGLAQGDGLYDAYFAYAVGQFLQRLGVELAAGLVGVGDNLGEFHLVYRG